jgi:hypothetical protein
MDSGLVFARPDGAPIHPDLITDWFRRLARAARPAADPAA